MLRQFLVGGGVSVFNIAIDALVMAIVVRVAQARGAENKLHPSVLLIAVMIPTVSVLMVAHAVEVIVWSLAYLTRGRCCPDRRRRRPATRVPQGDPGRSRDGVRFARPRSLGIPA